jgi:hypothetical protein
VVDLRDLVECSLSSQPQTQKVLKKKRIHAISDTSSSRSTWPMKHVTFQATIHKAKYRGAKE